LFNFVLRCNWSETNDFRLEESTSVAGTPILIRSLLTLKLSSIDEFETDRAADVRGERGDLLWKETSCLEK